MSKLYEKLGVSPENGPLLGVMYFSFFTSGILTVMIGALLPYIKDAHQLDYTQSGMLLSAHQIGNLCAVVFAGILPYVIGRKYSTLLLGSGITLGFLLMARTGNPYLLLLSFALTGVSKGTWTNICNTVIGQVSGNRTAALNILHAVFATGALLCPVIVFLCTDITGWGWAVSAQIVAALGLAVLICVAASRLPSKAEQRVKSEKSVTSLALRSASYWLTAGILFFYLGAETSIIGWFVTYFSEAGILSPTVSAFTPTMIWFMMMAGRLIIATKLNRLNKFRLTLGMGISFTAFFVMMLLSRHGAVSVISLLGIGVSIAGIYPTTFSTLKNVSSTMANGLLMGIASFGAILMPSIVGRVADARGLTGGVAVILVSCVGMVVLMIINLIRSQKLENVFQS